MAVAITQQGYGRIWLYADRQAAIMHPLIQWGDAIFEDEFELFDEYRLHELPGLLSRFEISEDLRTSLGARVAELEEAGYTTRRIRDALVAEQTAKDVYQALERKGLEPPADSETVCQLVRGDREACLLKGNRFMADAKEKAPKAAKEPKVKDNTIAGLDPKTKIKFGTAPDSTEKVKAVKEVKDKDGKVTTAAVPASEKTVPGKPYNGTDNNPKSRGAGERFAKYKNNMTLQQAVDAGCLPADIAWDLKKGFIVAA